ncbi:FxLYD domain-containing protein [Thermoclostridium stercorarium]|nr:FxLYD domain-containing protein [Thermoclostridium stercorarium]
MWKRLLIVGGLFIILIIFYSIPTNQPEEYKYGSYSNIEYSTLSETYQPKKKELIIVEGWKFELEGNYMYVRGSVENTGDKDISYYEIYAEYMDKDGKVIDSDWTNGTDVRVGAQQRFEIMTRYDERIERCRLSIREIW